MKKRIKRRGAVICGAYGFDNAGDDAILAAIVASLRRLDSSLPITVLARQPQKTEAGFDVEAVHPFRPLKWLRAMGSASLFISGGGSLLQDATSRRSLFFYLTTIRLAKRLGCRVMLYGCGIGPLRHERSRRKTAETLNACADVITLRDGDSLALLQGLSVIKPRLLLAADPVFSLEPIKGERERRFGVSLRPCPGFNEKLPMMAAAVRHVYETYRLAPVFFCLGPGDREAARRVCGLLTDIPCSISADPGRVGKMSLVLSMRLHGIIFALCGGAPAAGISYDPKIDALCREAGLPALSLDALTEEEAARIIDEAARLDAEQLFARVSLFRFRERVNLSAAAELLTESAG